jgi:hypothetical protein
MIMKVGLTVTTQDDTTLDDAMEAMERFAKETLREILHDPLLDIVISTSEGDRIPC